MKLELSDKKLVIFLSIVVVLLAANLFLMMQAKKEDNVSLYKSFAAQTHASMQQVKKDSGALDKGLLATADMNAEQRAQMALLREFYKSMNSDIEWVSGKENTAYWQLQATQNPITANELMRKEIAIMVVGNYIFALNNEAINDGMSELLERNDAAEEAEASLSWIEVTDLLNDDAAQQLITETMIQKNDIIEETKRLMNEYLELRKKEFVSAKDGSDEQYVAAMNLLELGYLLEVNAGNSELYSGDSN